MVEQPWLSINTIRTLAIDAIQKANSGHPGLPMGAAPMAYVLWQDHLKHCGAHPDWPDRDRFILSPGHGSMLLYALLHLHGYDLSLDDIKNFRQWQSKTPGHPEAFLTPGVEATTGPLGQGTANAVGMAIAERALAHRFNRDGHGIVDHFTYALVSDGDLMEGISAEAGALAGHLKLAKLIYLYDANDITLDGPTSLTFTEDIGKRYEAMGWHVQTISDGDHDVAGIGAALASARAETQRPSLLVLKTTIGFGSPNKAGTASSHGSPLGADEVAATKDALQWPQEEFHIPQEARQHFGEAINRGREAFDTWRDRFETYRAAFPDLAVAFESAMAGDLPEGWADDLPSFETGAQIATRSAGGKVLNAIAARVPALVGGDADLSCSTKTAISDGGTFDGQSGAGRNIHFGVREHAMGAIANGMAYHGGVRPYTATFFCFADYMRPAIRLAALNHLPAVFVFTHDSIGLGEDGPTHQAVEHLASLRCMPGVQVHRPADANETRVCWQAAMEHTSGPSILVLSRQNLPVLENTTLASRGGYVISDAEDPQALLLATGSEVALALEAQRQLATAGVSTRVVSLPSWERFVAQDADYREEVLPRRIKARIAVEAGVPFGWERFVGSDGAIIAVGGFGASAPGDELMQRYGFTVDNVVATTKGMLA